MSPEHRAPEDMSVPALTDRDREILDFEREWWRFAGVKESAIRDRFAMTASEYYRALGRLIDHEAAMSHDSLLVRRLRRQRLVRRRERSARRLERG